MAEDRAIAGRGGLSVSRSARRPADRLPEARRLNKPRLRAFATGSLLRYPGLETLAVLAFDGGHAVTDSPAGH
jgi:hypothetical protein